MSKSYKLRSSAVRAAKKEFGDNWLDFVSINEVLGEFEIEMRSQADIDAIQKVVSGPTVADQLAAIDAEAKAKKAKKAEIQSRKPAFIPSTPVTIDVAAIPAPIPEPESSHDEEIAPPADLIVPTGMAKIKVEFESIDAKVQAIADALANAQIVNVDPAKPKMSTVERPTKLVWTIADRMMIALGAMPKRKDVIEECVRHGIAYGTARTQHQHWFKCYNDSICAPIATIGKDGKIVPPQK